MGRHRATRKFDGKVYQFSTSGLRKFVMPEVLKLRSLGYPVRVVPVTNSLPDHVAVFVRWSAVPH